MLDFRKLLQATIKANKTGHFMWVGSDSWGAKVHPVREQEFAAEGAITILPFRNPLEGKCTHTISNSNIVDRNCCEQ